MRDINVSLRHVQLSYTSPTESYRHHQLFQNTITGATAGNLYYTMATQTTTVQAPGRRSQSRHTTLAPENERYLQACSDIASALIQDYEAKNDGSKPKRDINLNSLQTQMSKKHKLSTVPPLTAIIAAIPEHYKKYILPSLVAKPIRMYDLIGPPVLFHAR